MMNELNQSGDINQLANKIYEEMSSADPSITRIVGYLDDLRTKEEYQALSNSGFYDIVGETFKLNPDIFMKHIYEKFGQYKNKSEMEKYILEKYCLYDGEQILFEGSGKIVQKGDGGINSVRGMIYVTNCRIIVPSKLSTKKWTSSTDLNLIDVLGWAISPLRGNRDKRKSKEKLIEGSFHQELPGYGYQFPIKNHSLLSKNKDGINKTSYIFDKGKLKDHRFVTITLTHPDREKVDNLYGVLCKDTNQIVDSLSGLLEGGLKRSKKWFVNNLKSEECNHRSDSDYLYIVEETYKLDPEYFMSSIYPEMMSWKKSKFISVNDVKEKIKTFVDKLSEESGI